MLQTTQNGALKLTADTYSLTFPPDRPFVNLEDRNGKRLAELFVLASVHPLNGRDDTVQIGTWETVASGDEVIFSLALESAVWDCKIVRFRCRPHRFMYELEVEGQGSLSEASYFGGYQSAQVRWGSGFFWSGQHFKRGFNPEPNADEINFFPAAESSRIALLGVPLPGRSDWFFTPPPFCFGFEGDGSWMGLGVHAGPGENRFTEYGYHGGHSCFYLSLAFDGHTQVHGRYQLPAIDFDFGTGPYEVLAEHVKSLYISGSVPKPAGRSRLDWWYEPIFCGWGEQSYLAARDKGKAPDYARQALYEGFLETLDANGVNPGIVVIDDKWQANYGENRVDDSKWPDLPGFIRRQHEIGRKVLLWFKAWDPEGIPVEECITNARNLPLSVDPSNPSFEKRLRETIHILLSPEGYDADGFKIDFTARIPSGPGIHLYGDIWGLELMKRYLEIIYNAAKQVKPDALIITHTPHPYLAEVLDMIRLNDINKDKDVRAAMTHRAILVNIACPDAIIDTDNWPITNKSVWRDYLRLQPELGVPALYYASHIDSTLEPLEERDFKLIRQVWAKHRLSHQPTNGRANEILSQMKDPRYPASKGQASGSPGNRVRLSGKLKLSSN